MNRSTRLPQERVMRSHGLRIILPVAVLACAVAIAHAAQATRPATVQATAVAPAAMAKGGVASGGAAASAHQVARTQVCTVHKELRIGDYVIRHETCRESPAVIPR